MKSGWPQEGRSSLHAVFARFWLHPCRFCCIYTGQWSAFCQISGRIVKVGLTVKKILNHVERDITAVYDRHSYDAEKREALEVWAKRLTAIISEKTSVAPQP